MMEDRVKRTDEKFCHECGEVIRAKAEICPKCGCRQNDAQPIRPTGLDAVFSGRAEKSRTTAAALAILLGGVGAHKFYLGKPVYGILYAVFVMTFIPAIFGLIEGIHYLTMSDEEFSDRLSANTLHVFFGKASKISPDTHVKCPDCRALVPKEARVCQHCRCILVPQT